MIKAGLFILAAVGVYASLSNAQESSRPVIEYVRSSAGFIRGQTNGDVDQFKNPFIAFADEETDDSPFGCAVTQLSQALSASAPIYRYEFDDA